MLNPTHLLLTLWAFASHVLSSPAPAPAPSLPVFEFDPAKRASQAFKCPLWKGPLPDSAQDLAGSTCSNTLTRTFTHGSITTRLYQVPGSWQQNERYSEIVNGVADGIKKGLPKFGTLAGPLTINIGFVSGVLGDLVQVDDDNSGTKNPCYIIIDFPPSWVKYPLVAIQKDVIKGMYQCVEQFHRPTVTTWTDGNEWWRRGIARYFDGLSYPATSAILNRGLYPEEYQHGIPFYQNSDATALFFHFADGLAGWTPTDVHNWMKTHANKATYDQERTSLSTDTKITSSLFHRFILACKDKTIKYPNGQKITYTLSGPPERVYSVVNLSRTGSEYSKTVAISAWKGATHVFPIKAGQTMRLSMEVKAGIEWSIRKVGTTAWKSGDRTRSVTISAAGSDTKYEIAVSSTRDDAGSGLSKVKMTRTA
ncbi:hypothetical protein B0T10DRAFT_566943 [Thelonectria olida]|uniref:Uncharacterized protein n=1 Tax=Thelonectria olida TaxID=1576542 RepID=A0A9P8VTH3_9HYPO|nr:hypothetical protein B0T10DRAFT_566943 [Thelonectria olida]